MESLWKSKFDERWKLQEVRKKNAIMYETLFIRDWLKNFEINDGDQFAIERKWKISHKRMLLK